MALVASGAMQTMAEDDFADILCRQGDFVHHLPYASHPTHADGVQNGRQSDDQQDERYDPVL